MPPPHSFKDGIRLAAPPFGGLAAPALTDYITLAPGLARGGPCPHVLYALVSHAPRLSSGPVFVGSSCFTRAPSPFLPLFSAPRRAILGPPATPCSCPRHAQHAASWRIPQPSVALLPHTRVSV